MWKEFKVDDTTQVEYQAGSLNIHICDISGSNGAASFKIFAVGGYICSDEIGFQFS
jgi:hypothetical protein